MSRPKSVHPKLRHRYLTVYAPLSLSPRLVSTVEALKGHKAIASTPETCITWEVDVQDFAPSCEIIPNLVHCKLVWGRYVQAWSSTKLLLGRCCCTEMSVRLVCTDSKLVSGLDLRQQFKHKQCTAVQEAQHLKFVLHPLLPVSHCCLPG